MILTVKGEREREEEEKKKKKKNLKNPRIFTSRLASAVLLLLLSLYIRA